jgi:hypothetical protein
MIETKIAKIVSPTMVILAAGSEEGVKEGMEFLIYELGDEIRDPENGESLGRLELPKGRVRVQHVQDKMSFATTPSRETRVPDWFAFGSVKRTQEELRIDKNAATLVQPDLTVRIGDQVRSVGEHAPKTLSVLATA